ncbi:MAG: hypothetical protein ACJAS4_002817 [Bacteriovoracaceae bacterium]
MQIKLAIVLLSITPLAFAEGTIEKLLGLPNIQKEIQCEHKFKLVSSAFKVKSEDKITCDDVSWIDTHLQKVQKISPISPKVNLEIFSRSDSASFDIGQTISIPLALTFPNQWGTRYFGSPLEITPIIYHEYAHAIFTNLLGKKFYPNLKKDAKKLSKLKIELQRAYANGNPAGIAQSHERRIKALIKNLKSNKDYKVYEMTTSYNELFADLVAVLITKDKDCIMNALYYSEIDPQAYNRTKLRSFSNIDTQQDNRELYEKHAELALVRQFLGHEYLDQVFESDVLKSDLLAKVLIAIETVIIQRIEKGDLGLNPKINNQVLIKEIKKILK